MTTGAMVPYTILFNIFKGYELLTKTFIFAVPMEIKKGTFEEWLIAHTAQKPRADHRDSSARRKLYAIQQIF